MKSPLDHLLSVTIFPNDYPISLRLSKADDSFNQ
jgi:hypothetical protein